MIVLAFAAGDRRTLKDLLSKDVFDGFVAAISEREGRGETMESRSSPSRRRRSSRRACAAAPAR